MDWRAFVLDRNDLSSSFSRRGSAVESKLCTTIIESLIFVHTLNNYCHLRKPSPKLTITEYRMEHHSHLWCSGSGMSAFLA
jgi:hypothetical protein